MGVRRGQHRLAASRFFGHREVNVSFQEIDFGVKGCIARLKWFKIGLSTHNSLETRLLDALNTHHVAVHWLASSTPMQACTSLMGRFYYWYWHLQ